MSWSGLKLAEIVKRLIKLLSILIKGNILKGTSPTAFQAGFNQRSALVDK